MPYTRESLEKKVDELWKNEVIKGIHNSKENLAFFLLKHEGVTHERKKYPNLIYSPPDERGEPRLDTFILGAGNVYGLNPGCRYSKSIRIEYTGSRTGDFKKANQHFYKQDNTPDGFVWHHFHDYNHGTHQGTMYLMHNYDHDVFHWGGVSQYCYAHNGDDVRGLHYK